MPRYDFACSCGRTTEIDVPLKDVPYLDEYGVECDYCEGGRAFRQPSAPAFTIKGYAAKNGYSSKS